MAIKIPFWQTVKGPYPESPVVEKLTAAGVEFIVKNGHPPPKNGDARADAQTGDGLKMIVRFDEANRPIREFVNTGNHKRWMDTFKARPEEMLALNVSNLPQDMFEARRERSLANQQLRAQVARDPAKFRGVDLATGEPL